MAYLPQYPTYQPRPLIASAPSDPQPNPVTGDPGYNPFNSRDAFDLWQRLGLGAYNRGQNWEDEFSGLSNYYGNAAQGYGNRVEELYNPIWGGGGGYTPEMMRNIIQGEGLDDISNQLGGNQLQQWEQNRISGDPYGAFDLFRGQAANLSNTAAGYGDEIRNQANAGYARGLGAVDEMRQGYRQAIDPSRMRLSEGYMPAVQEALAYGRSGTERALQDPDLYFDPNDPSLNLTPEYLRQAGMTDEEVGQMAASSARDTGAQWQATKDKLYQDAAASGTATPLGLAAAESAMNRSSGAAQNDALLRGRLAARGAQREAATGIQDRQLDAGQYRANTRLNSGQYRAGLGSQNALAVQNAALAGNTTAEQLRLAAEGGLTDRQLQTIGNIGNAALNNAQFGSNLATNAAGRAGDWNIDTGRFNATMGTNLMGQGDVNASNRAAQIAGNRQATNQYNQGMQFNINNALSNRYQQAYNPWVAAQQEGRAAAQGQQGYYGNQANTQNNFRLGGWGQSNQGQQGAAQGYAGWGTTGGQGFGDNFSRSFANTFGQALGSWFAPAGSRPSSGSHSNDVSRFGFEHGGVIDENQLIEVGEDDRPEVILPLDPTTPEEKQNIWERMGSELGEALGIGKKSYATGGIIGLDAPNLFARNLSEYEDATDEDEDIDDPWYMRRYARGGVVCGNNYRSNIGKHNSPNPLPFSEMGSIASPAYA